MSGTLYLVATPIGNLGDLSPRGVQTLQEADFIAAEDTRVSMKLLNHFDIKKPLVSYHEHNRAAAGQAILARLLAGETCALVTDAGTPAISDPGEDLVRLCGENGVTVQAIPGCCAAVCALAVSGLPTGRFTFEGFLSANKKERREALTRLAAEERTMVFHEAPHKLRPTLADMLELLGDRPVALCRELTKLHEETIRTTLSGAVALYREKEPRGEYVLVVAGAPRQEAPALPELSEVDLSRHYTELCQHVHGVNCGFYPLGSCTMKYNPRIDEEMAALPGFAGVHPLAPEHAVAGCREVLDTASRYLCQITGMDGMTFQPAAGAHGEFTGVLLIKQYHDARGDHQRTKIIVPDSAHGTNPATAAMCGYQVVNIPSAADGCVDLEALKAVLGDDVAGLMLTNPNTVGIFDENILEITRLVHEAGGLCYYDGANLNAVMGIVRPGDMGFDCIHMNLHKTFATPHGGGGPGAGAVGCKAFLEPYLPQSAILSEGEHLQVRAFNGNFLVVVKALAYLLTLGREGIPEAAENAVLNANYLMRRIQGTFQPAFDRICMHEFVLGLEEFKKETGVSALDVAKTLIDYGMHPPTMYFPLIVHEALMLEPTETESRETLDEAAEIFRKLYELGHKDPEYMHAAPHHAQIGRPDEVQAARNPILRWTRA